MKKYIAYLLSTVLFISSAASANQSNLGNLVDNTTSMKAFNQSIDEVKTLIKEVNNAQSGNQNEYEFGVSELLAIHLAFDFPIHVSGPHHVGGIAYYIFKVRHHDLEKFSLILISKLNELEQGRRKYYLLPENERIKFLYKEIERIELEILNKEYTKSDINKWIMGTTVSVSALVFFSLNLPTQLLGLVSGLMPASAVVLLYLIYKAINYSSNKSEVEALKQALNAVKSELNHRIKERSELLKPTLP